MSRARWKFQFTSREIVHKLISIERKGRLIKSRRFIFSRASVISKPFLKTPIYVYTGRKFKRRQLTRWMIGFRFGEFTWNRKKALYKAKQTRKKRQKEKKAKQTKQLQMRNAIR